MCFAKEGADVLFTYLPEEEKDAERTRKLVEQAGPKAIGVPRRYPRKVVLRKIGEENADGVRSTRCADCRATIKNDMTDLLAGARCTFSEPQP